MSAAASDNLPLITVAGGPGTGTTTLCKLLAKRLGVPHVYAGQIFRDMARERGMDVVQFNHYSEKHPEVDHELDYRMIEVARKGHVVLEGRMSVWHARLSGARAVRVLLVAPEEVRARRVAQRENKSDVEAVLAENRERETSESLRYRTLYGMDPADPAHYDLVIDTADLTPDEIADRVVAALPKAR
ncbi:MAG TPA: cytidylate kinase family protein [Candidatus Thermoplasmatota archaeon]|nr:cytidylate kinase family protein [Candidatus Thermoplasmatota archaeon]